jgi:hypothetical protein
MRFLRAKISAASGFPAFLEPSNHLSPVLGSPQNQKKEKTKGIFFYFFDCLVKP